MGVQPFKTAALAGHYFRRLPASCRAGTAEAEYVKAAIAAGQRKPDEAAQNERFERQAIRREHDPAFDAARRRRERRAIRGYHAQMRIEASRQPHERRISPDGRSLLFVGSSSVTPTAPATRSREQGRGPRRRIARTSSSSSNDPGGEPASDDPHLAGSRARLRAGSLSCRGPPGRTCSQNAQRSPRVSARSRKQEHE